MHNVEIDLPATVDSAVVERVIDDAIREAGLTVTLRGSLKQFPGCVHWHAKQGRESGTLEATLWPREGRAWFSVQRGRRSEWIDALIGTLQRSLRERLAACGVQPETVASRRSSAAAD